MKIILFLLSLLNLGTLVPWFISASMSVMMFDSPDATKSVLPYLIIFLLLLYPIFVVFCLYKTWTTFFIGWAVAPLLLSLLFFIVVSVL